MSAILRFDIEGSLGNEGPDGFRVFFAQDAQGELLLGTTVFMTADQFRAFWHEAGEQLRAFDEKAGAPSNQEER